MCIARVAVQEILSEWLVSSSYVRVCARLWQSCRALIEHGANVALVDAQERSLVHLAAKHGAISVLEAIKKTLRPSAWKMRLSSKAGKLATLPYQLAAAFNQTECIAWLIEQEPVRWRKAKAPGPRPTCTSTSWLTAARIGLFEADRQARTIGAALCMPTWCSGDHQVFACSRSAGIQTRLGWSNTDSGSTLRWAQGVCRSSQASWYYKGRWQRRCS